MWTRDSPVLWSGITFSRVSGFGLVFDGLAFGADWGYSSVKRFPREIVRMKRFLVIVAALMDFAA